MVAEENKVALVVKRHHAPSVELGFLGKNGGEHPPHSVAHPSGEVVQNQLGVVVRRATVVADFLRQHWE